jgi:hypothetical protein
MVEAIAHNGKQISEAKKACVHAASFQVLLAIKDI